MSLSQKHLDRFIRFCREHTQDHETCDMCSSMPHLCDECEFHASYMHVMFLKYLQCNAAKLLDFVI